MTTQSVPLRVSVLGPLAVELDGRALPAPSSRRAWELLGFFALRPGPLPRSEVASVLWPDVLDTSARGSLRSAMWSLRRTFAGAGAADRLIASRDAVGLFDDGWLWVDLRTFDEALVTERREEALSLCRGPLLQGIDAEWVLAEREAFADRVGDVLGKLTEAALGRGDSTLAVRWARRRVAAAPLDEAAARALMEALSADGDRSAALEVQRRLAQRLRRELGVTPSAATRELAERLRRAPPQRRAAASPPTRAGPVTALVGRGRELGLLDGARDALRTGRGGVVVVSGEAGIGKSTLAHELLARLERDGVQVAACAAPATGLPTPYGQWAELMSSLDADAWIGAGDGGPSVPPELQRARLREAAVELAERVSADRGLALLLDDAHAIDARSLELLGHVARRLRDRPLLLVLTRRHYPRSLDVDALLHRLALSGVDVLSIEAAPLDARAAAELVRARTRLDERAVQEVVLLTDGNPLLLLESARALERGEPATAGLIAMVRAAVSRLAPSARELAELVAVRGGKLSSAEVLALDAVDAAELALDSGLLEVDGDGVRFRHALLRDAVYDEIPSPRRAGLHARCAELAIAAGDRAHHLLLAGQDRRATAALAEASDRALALGAIEEATVLVRDALAIDPHDAALHVRLARAEAWRGEAAAAEAALGRALAAHDPRDHLGVAGIWLEAAQWYRSSLCDPSRTREAAQQALRHAGGDDRLRSEALAAAAWSGAMLGALDDADRELAAAAELDRERRLTFDLALVRAHVLVMRGDPQASLTAFQDAAAAVRPAGRPDLAYSVWMHAAAVAAFAGDLERALCYVERCLEDAGRIDFLRVPALAARAYVLARMGRAAEARTAAARQLEVADLLDDPALRAVAQHDAGMVAMAAGDHASAVAHLTAALDAGARVSRAVALLARAEAYARLGDADAAAADLRAVALVPLRPVDAPHTLVPRLTRVQGLAAVARGDVALARRRLEEAAEGWRRLLATGGDALIDAWVANIVDLGRPPAAGLVEPARELDRTLADLEALTREVTA